MNDRWVLATRSDDDLRLLAAALGKRGVRVVAFPVLHEEPAVLAPVDLATLAMACSLIVFTSRRAPAALRRHAGQSWPALVGLQAAAVGTVTAEAAQAEGFRVVVVGTGGGTALAKLLRCCLAPGATVLYPCGREHREELARALTEAGISVVPLVVYSMAESTVDTLPTLPVEPPVAVLLTSPRATRAYVRVAGDRFADVPHVAMGATTAAAAAEVGIAAHALESTKPESVVEELCRTCL